MWDVGGRRIPYPPMNPGNYNKNGHVRRYNGSMNLMGVINQFLTEFEALSTRGNACLVL